MGEAVYHSKYTDPNKLITAQQYLAERICERKAAVAKKSLCFRFWNKTEWGRYYKNQVQMAAKLLQKCSMKAILLALKDYPKAYSFGLKPLRECCAEHQAKLDKQNVIKPEVFEYTVSSTEPRPVFNKTSLFSKM